MGDKRKNTADGKTPPSKGRPGHKPKAPAPAFSPVAVQAPPAMGLPVLKTTTQLVPAPAANAVARLAALPPPSSPMVRHHQPEHGGGLLELVRAAVAVSAAEEEGVRLLDSDVSKTVLLCDVCHGPLKLPIYQCTLLRHVACRYCGARKCSPCAELRNAAFFVKSSYLDTLFGCLKLPCPYKKFGCASSVAYSDVAAHTAVCAFKPCLCPECSFEGSPAELVRHLSDKAGQHAWPVRNITYGSDQVFVVNVQELNQKDISDQPAGFFLLVAEDDGTVFLLAVARSLNDGAHHVDVLCVRGNAGTGPVYSSSVTVEGPPAKVRRYKMEKKAVASCCPVPVEFDVDAEPPCDAVVVYPEMLHGETMHLRICIDKI